MATQLDGPILIGNVLALSHQPLDAAGQPVDADTVLFTIEPHFGAPITVAPTEYDPPSTYRYFWEPVLPGGYTLRVVTTNPDFADEIEVYIRPSGII